MLRFLRYSLPPLAVLILSLASAPTTACPFCSMQGQTLAGEVAGADLQTGVPTLSDTSTASSSTAQYRFRTPTPSRTHARQRDARRAICRAIDAVLGATTSNRVDMRRNARTVGRHAASCRDGCAPVELGLGFAGLNGRAENLKDAELAG